MTAPDHETLRREAAMLLRAERHPGAAARVTIGARTPRWEAFDLDLDETRRVLILGGEHSGRWFASRLAGALGADIDIDIHAAEAGDALRTVDKTILARIGQDAAEVDILMIVACVRMAALDGNRIIISAPDHRPGSLGDTLDHLPRIVFDMKLPAGMARAEGFETDPFHVQIVDWPLFSRLGAVGARGER